MLVINNEEVMSSGQNINTLDYWDRRFGTGDWEAKGGFSQTRVFAESQIRRLGLPEDFSGILCDFGCGAGDAFPIYRNAFPKARLIGVDFSAEAIRLCREKYSNIAEFVQGDFSAVPICNVVITSNVLEHLDNDQEVVQKLLYQCDRLFVIVPYQEQYLCSEHIRTYSDDSFSKFSVIRKVIFPSRGWSQFGLRRYIGIYIGNVFRFLFRHQLRRRNMQIMFEILKA